MNKNATKKGVLCLLLLMVCVLCACNTEGEVGTTKCPQESAGERVLQGGA